MGFIRTVRDITWLSKIVPIVKKKGKIQVCIDFRNLNLTSPKDEHPVPLAYLKVDGEARHKVMSFMDGHSSYNQIFVDKTDTTKTTFK